MSGVDRIRGIGELSARLGRCGDLDALLSVALRALDELFGYEHSLLLLTDESGSRLYTIANHGYAEQGIGSEVPVGEGIIGMAAARATPMRIGNLRQMLRYSRAVRRTYEAQIGEAPGREIPLPGLVDVESQLAVPAMVLGQVVGVLAIETVVGNAYADDDESLLLVVAGLIASAIEIDAANEHGPVPSPADRAPRSQPAEAAAATRVKFFAVDGSTFLDGEYVIKGVAGRILWSLLGHYDSEGRRDFTNKEVRLDPTLELPEFRDNLESRLIMLKRRLAERDAPIRIEKTGRGRFRLDVDTPLKLERVATES